MALLNSVKEIVPAMRMFYLGARCTPPKVSRVPYIPMLKESNTRKGFYEYEEYIALKNALPEEVKPIVTFAYHSGWRKNEILTLTWDRVNLREGIVRLDPGEAKNEEDRTLYMNDEFWRKCTNCKLKGTWVALMSFIAKGSLLQALERHG
jgi:integrase